MSTCGEGECTSNEKDSVSPSPPSKRLKISEPSVEHRPKRMKETGFGSTWKIPNFVYEAAKGETLESPVFSAGFQNEFKWHLRMSFTKEDESDWYVSLYMGPFSYDVLPVNLRYTFTTWQYDMDEHFKKNCVDDDILELDEGYYYGFRNYSSLEDLKDSIRYRSNKVEISVRGSVIQNILQVGLPKCTLAEDLAPLFENRKFGDVTFSAGGKELVAHRAMLTARSPVFDAMFKHRMEETEQNRVVITDLDYEVLKEMLVYVYTGTSPNVEKVATDLLVAADKYDLCRLKVMCINAICSTLTVENAVQSLLLADLYRIEHFVDRVVAFIASHIGDILHLSEWKDIIPTHPHLINRVIEDLA